MMQRRTYILRHTDVCEGILTKACNSPLRTEYERCDLVNSFLHTQQVSTIMEQLMKTTRHKSLPEVFDDDINPWIS